MLELFTINEVADIFKCHPQTVRSYIKEGLLGALKLKGEYRITQQDIDAFLKRNKTAGKI
ncbi:MAG: helix-turn-helix domain-containing protein [Clostridia bacterium]|jgi:excisionase family DNA binding protein|nr:helix-turn-helix domain-containing protein [Clostridia bacterium]